MPGTLEAASLTSVTARFAETSAQEYGDRVNDLWAVGEDIRNVLRQHVESGNCQPTTACGIIAGTMAQLFGYGEFFGIVNPSPLSAGLWMDQANGKQGV
jgi:hypothetical protein